MSSEFHTAVSLDPASQADTTRDINFDLDWEDLALLECEYEQT